MIDDAPAASPDPEMAPIVPPDPHGDLASGSSGNARVDHLAGQIGPRPSGSSREQRAAEYVRSAFGAQGIHAISIDAQAPMLDSWPELICLIGGLCALLATLYSGIVGTLFAALTLLAYLSDALLHPRVLAAVPSGRSASVLAIVPARRPDCRRLVLTAGLDSPRMGVLASAQFSRLAEHLRVWVAVSIALALLAAASTVLVDSVRANYVLVMPAALMVVMLALIAEREWRGEYSPGAITNASSVAALIDIAERVHARPLEWVELWFLAVAATTPCNAGFRRFLAENRFDADTTAFLNFESIGAGTLHYAIVEGTLRPHRAAPLLARLAAAAGHLEPTSGTRRLARLWLDTAAGVAIEEGYQAMTIVGCGDDGLVPHRAQPSDTIDNVDARSIDRAARLALYITGLVDDEMAERQRMARLARHASSKFAAHPRDANADASLDSPEPS